MWRCLLYEVLRNTSVSPTNFSYDCPQLIDQLSFLKKHFDLDSANWYNYAPYAPLVSSIPLISSALKTQRTQRTQRTNATRKYFNMAEKKADAPAAGMLWGGRFTGWNVSGNKLQMQYTNLTMRRCH